MPWVILSFPRGIPVEALEMSAEKPGELAPLPALGQAVWGKNHSFEGRLSWAWQ